MLLLDEAGNITHLNVLLLGPAHVGKTSLRTAFLNGSARGPNRVRTRGPWQGSYDPTIESSDTVQYILPSSSTNAGVSPMSPADSSSSASTLSDDVSDETPVITEEDLWQKRTGQRIVLTLSDVGGHPFYGTIWASAIAAADAFMLVYDVGSRQSFEAMWGFYRLIVETKWARPHDVPIMMLGNMVDNVTSDPTVHLLDKRPRQVTRDMGQSFANLLRLPFTETTVMAPQSVAHCFRQLILIAQEQSRSMVTAGLAARADGAGLLSPLYRNIRRPSNASVVGSDAGSESGATRHSQVSTQSTGAAVERVYGAVSRTQDGVTMLDPNRDSICTDMSTTSTSDANAIASAPTNSVTDGMAGRPRADSSSSSHAPALNPLPPPRPDSIRFRRDMVFRAWRAFQRSPAYASALPDESRHVIRSLVTSSGSSGSRPSSPGPILPVSAIPARSESLAPRQGSSASSTSSSSSCKPQQDSGIYIPDMSARKHSLGSTAPTLSTVASGYSDVYAASRTSMISTADSRIDVRELESGPWDKQEQPPLMTSSQTAAAQSRQAAMRRYRSSEDISRLAQQQQQQQQQAQQGLLNGGIFAAPIPVPAPAPVSLSDGIIKTHSDISSRSSTPVPTPAPTPSAASTPKRLQRSQQNLQMLLDQLEMYSFESDPASEDDQASNLNESCKTGSMRSLNSGIVRSKSMSCLTEASGNDSRNVSSATLTEIPCNQGDLPGASQSTCGPLSPSHYAGPTPIPRSAQDESLEVKFSQQDLPSKSSEDSVPFIVPDLPAMPTHVPPSVLAAANLGKGNRANLELLRSILAELDEREVREIVQEFGLKTGVPQGGTSVGGMVG
ncbi:uncharacterized protein SPPG_00215 [Spizellomyces punctatus DAOM BR117]|uniref:Small GTP-binding protein domain n=1 Tax=Spizellomyces punctatus (strain DAOM BR117) TaxID=645134 RepID=A0A0L0HTR5_SPIPD|nr:uncharacterized protein SPPG_00215 [Spizellomyces punctatus DAOM BR117]KND04487.1 hypothetical protein SPPG_00215 [Spizellomyces punctatus DAOM BR117]|eukprot:XP_016612526.1 hypothetical protein SPPG_00215 [Spizellomyces punctatus DAOM BR117]